MLLSCDTGCRGCTPDLSIGTSWTLLSRDGNNLTTSVSQHPYHNPFTSVSQSFHSAYCDTDHSLVCSKVQSHPKKLHRARSPAKARINVAATAIPEKVLAFRELLQTKLENCHALGTEDHWKHVKDVTHDAAMQAFGKKDPKSVDWFDANIKLLQPLIEAKRAALQNYQRNPTPQSLETLREARRHVKAECKKSANDYWMNLCAKI